MLHGNLPATKDYVKTAEDFVKTDEYVKTNIKKHISDQIIEIRKFSNFRIFISNLRSNVIFGITLVIFCQIHNFAV